MSAPFRRSAARLFCVTALALLAGCGLFGGKGKPVPGVETPKVEMKKVQKEVGDGVRPDTENRAYSADPIPPQ